MFYLGRLQFASQAELQSKRPGTVLSEALNALFRATRKRLNIFARLFLFRRTVQMTAVRRPPPVAIKLTPETVANTSSQSRTSWPTRSWTQPLNPGTKERKIAVTRWRFCAQAQYFCARWRFCAQVWRFCTQIGGVFRSCCLSGKGRATPRSYA